VNEKEKSKFYKCRESFKDNKGTNLRLRFEHGDLEIMDYLIEIKNFHARILLTNFHFFIVLLV